MRISLFTGTLVIVLAAVILTGELSLRENRVVMRKYGELSEATEKAIDDACEYLSVLREDDMGIREESAEYAESIFKEAMAASLGIDNAIFEDTTENLIAVFAALDGKGSVTLRSKRSGNAWKRVQGLKNNDEIAAVLSEELGEEIFLPDNTGLTGWKAGCERSLIVCVRCRLGRGLSGQKSLMCIRNTRLRKR